MIYGYQHSKGHVCIKIENPKTGKRISLTLDDSCKGELNTKFIRCSMIIENKEGKQEGEEIFHSDIFDLFEAIKKII